MIKSSEKLLKYNKQKFNRDIYLFYNNNLFCLLKHFRVLLSSVIKESKNVQILFVCPKLLELVTQNITHWDYSMSFCSF